MRLTNKTIGLFLALCLGLTSAVAFAQSDKVKQAIESRLKPAGELCMVGEDCAAAPAATASAEPRSGQEVFENSCAMCHGEGKQVGAPIINVASDWEARLEKGMDTLYVNAIDGYNAMPAMGLCNNCSEEEVMAAVDYMIEDVK